MPGSLKAWCETLQRFGTLALADVMAPAIKHASRGFAPPPSCMNASPTARLLKDKLILAVYLPNGTRSKPAAACAQNASPNLQAEIAEYWADDLHHGLI